MKDLDKMIGGVEPTLVEFYAPWCPHCQRMMPVMNEVIERFKDKANVVQIDGDQNAALCETYKVRSYPTFILFKEGQEVWRDGGEKPYSELADMLHRFI